MLADMLGIPMENTVAAGIPRERYSDAEGGACGVRDGECDAGSSRRRPNYITENDCDHSGVAEIIEIYFGVEVSRRQGRFKRQGGVNGTVLSDHFYQKLSERPLTRSLCLCPALNLQI